MASLFKYAHIKESRISQIKCPRESVSDENSFKELTPTNSNSLTDYVVFKYWQVAK